MARRPPFLLPGEQENVRLGGHAVGRAGCAGPPPAVTSPGFAAGKSGPSTTFPSRLREGLGEGVSASDVVQNRPSPDPSRKREGRVCRYFINTNSSAIVGCSATVWSNASLVSPAFTATAAAWRISAASGPIMWMPRILLVSLSQIIL